MRNYLFRILRPKFWIQNYPSSKILDKWMNQKLDEGKLKLGDNCHAKLDGKSIWIENYPYSFGCVIGKPHFLPFARTRKRLYEELIKLGHPVTTEQKLKQFLNRKDK